MAAPLVTRLPQCLRTALTNCKGGHISPPPVVIVARRTSPPRHYPLLRRRFPGGARAACRGKKTKTRRRNLPDADLLIGEVISYGDHGRQLALVLPLLTLPA